MPTPFLQLKHNINIGNVFLKQKYVVQKEIQAIL